LSLDRITIKNFQSHEDTTLFPAPGVTVLVGSSDHGKSAILRALEWLRNNRPLGEGVIRRDATGRKASETSVEVEMDGHTIGRVRGTDSKYYVDDQEFRAFGSDVPTDVTNTLWEDICVQRQLDRHFLLLDTKASETLDAITGLSEVEKLLELLGRWGRETSSQIKMLDAEASEVEKSLADPLFMRLTLYQSTLAALSGTVEKETGLTTQQNELGVLLSDIGQVSSQLRPVNENAIQKLGETIVELEELGKAETQLRREHDSLSALEKDIQRVENRIVEVDDTLVPKLVELLGGVGEIDVALRDVEREQSNLGRLVENLGVLETRLSKVMGEVANTSSKLDAAVIEAISKSGKCPVCEAPIRVGVTQQVISNVMCLCLGSGR